MTKAKTEETEAGADTSATTGEQGGTPQQVLATQTVDNTREGKGTNSDDVDQANREAVANSIAGNPDPRNGPTNMSAGYDPIIEGADDLKATEEANGDDE